MSKIELRTSRQGFRGGELTSVKDYASTKATTELGLADVTRLTARIGAIGVSVMTSPSKLMQVRVEVGWRFGSPSRRSAAQSGFRKVRTEESSFRGRLSSSSGPSTACFSPNHNSSRKFNPLRALEPSTEAKFAAEPESRSGRGQGKGQEADSGSDAGKAGVAAIMRELLDLEKQFAFYGAYHSNKFNFFIHILFVWPIFYTSLILWGYTPALAPFPLPPGTLPLQQYMVLNVAFVQAAVYGVYFIALDKKAGTLGALICLACWVGANAVAQALPWSFSWKIVLASQIVCWFSQIYGHQKFEGRAPALLDNLPQAFLMAPLFVLLEILSNFGYEPYPGFHKKVQKKVDAAILEFRAEKAKKVT